MGVRIQWRMLGNGSGKSRSNREGYARPAAHWRTLFLSSGELSLADKIAEDGRGRRAAGGQSVRLIDLPADAGAGLGLFEDLHGLVSADAFARHLKSASTSAYGTPARSFLRYVADNLENIRRTMAEQSRKFVADLIEESADGKVVRVAHRFALIGIAGELAISAGVLPWAAGTAHQASRRCFQDWLEARGGIESSDINEGIEQVRAFIAAHGMSRFAPVWEGGASDHIIREVAGYRKREGEAWDYYLTPSAWKDEVCRGLNASTVAAALIARHLMIGPDTGSHRSCVVRVPERGTLRLYHLSSMVLEYEKD
jgi:putative DNA primase/helicase